MMFEDQKKKLGKNVWVRRILAGLIGLGTAAGLAWSALNMGDKPETVRDAIDEVRAPQVDQLEGE